MARLEEVQAQANERIARLEEAMARLAEAQAQANERMARLEEAIAQLTEAQARTEARTEELAQAYVQMQEVMRSLIQQVGQLSQQVGRLSDVVGFTLEDLAREVTPAYLAQHYGIRVEELERRFFTLEGQEIEIDLYGEGWRDSEPIVVIGEVRSRIYGRDVEAVVRRASELRPQVSGTPVVVLFGFVVHPSAKEVASRLGAIVISSSGR
jgi:predicted nuclease with TOPRIM domain